jgi:hypothetical protein
MEMTMNKTAIFLAMALLLPFGATQAAELDDVTMQVLESNDPSEMTNDIALPEIEKSVGQEQEDTSSNHEDTIGDSRDDAEKSADENKSDIESEMESEVEEATQEAEDSREEVEDNVNEVEQATAEETTDN